MSDIIRARSLLKRFDDLIAVDGIDLTVREGECFGLLGPNGAGKTSTIKMITCVSPPTAGELMVGGMDVMTEGRRIKATLGVVPQEENLDPDLSVLQNLAVYARYFDIPASEARRRAVNVSTNVPGSAPLRSATTPSAMSIPMLIVTASRQPSPNSHCCHGPRPSRSP